MEHMARVLIVDDVAENISIIKNILKEKYDVIAAITGEKALELVSKEDSLPDLILLDILMPDMDGFEVCQKLKANPKTKNIPVIFLTVLDHVEDMIKGFELGGVDYITKPFEVNVLLARVNTHVQLKQYQDQLVNMLHEKDKFLIQQSKLASLGEMFETIMHQWKQPLSIISTSNANIRVENELQILTNASLLKMLDGIDTSIEHLTQTIDLFRDYLLETTQKEYFSANDLIQRILKLLAFKIENSNIHINLDIQKCEILTFKNHLIQVLINIINNAIYILEKHQDEKIINICVKKSDDKIIISVSDNGGGIDQENIEYIFEKNFTTKKNKKGSGLGLYICKQIVKDYLAGEITAKNTHNGASFTIYLPSN